MKHYVQLKDGVVFAAHSSPSNVDDSGPNVWEVETDASDKLGKLYSNGQFSDAPVIKYATVDSSGTVLFINETKYSSQVTGPVITSDNVKVFWTWDGANFIDPQAIESEETPAPEESSQP
jgi:hypothetical protein